jgi:alpha-methylacyl-CoA racemase
MMLIAGLLAALFQRTRTGKGQVIDASMVEGASMLAAPIHAFMAAGLWNDRRGQNLLDSGTPFYDTYETADGRHMAVGCLEPQFFAEFARLLPLDARFIGAQYDNKLWPQMREEIAAKFRQKTRDQWAEIFAGTDACVSPVLSFAEAKQHPHAIARQAFVKVGELERPAPSPRFSASPAAVAAPPDKTALAPSAILARFGISESEAEALVKSGIVGQ